MAGRSASVIVSPIFVEWRSLMPAMTYPTIPTVSSGTTCAFGVKIPTSWTSETRSIPSILTFMPGPDRPVLDADEAGDAPVDVEPGVEEERPERAVGVPRRRRDVVDDLLEELAHAGPDLPGREHRVLRRDPDDLLDLLAGHLGDRAREVDLVDAGDDRQVVVDREVGVRERLRLDPLRRVDDEDRPLAGRQRPGDLVGEVDVARACRSG